jgi:hypothetical protein
MLFNIAIRLFVIADQLGRGVERAIELPTSAAVDRATGDVYIAEAGSTR